MSTARQDDFNPPYTVVKRTVDRSKGIDMPRRYRLDFISEIPASSPHQMVDKVRDYFTPDYLSTYLSIDANLDCTSVRELYEYLDFYYLNQLENRIAEWITVNKPGKSIAGLKAEDDNSDFLCIIAQCASLIRAAVKAYVRLRTDPKSLGFGICDPEKTLKPRNLQMYGCTDFPCPSFEILRQRKGLTCKQIYASAHKPSASWSGFAKAGKVLGVLRRLAGIQGPAAESPKALLPSSSVTNAYQASISRNGAAGAANSTAGAAGLGMGVPNNGAGVGLGMRAPNNAASAAVRAPNNAAGAAASAAAGAPNNGARTIGGRRRKQTQRRKTRRNVRKNRI